MVVFDLYSKRRRRELGLATDVFQYDSIPQGLRTQVLHIWGDAIGIPYVTFDGAYQNDRVEKVYQSIAQILRREYSRFKLSNAGVDPNSLRDAFEDVKTWFLSETNSDRVLDCIELSFWIINERCSRAEYVPRRDNRRVVDTAINELNVRFKESGVGYQFSDNKIIRIDSQLIHAEAVVPALAVLRAPEYSNAQEEFLSAYEHYRHGKYEEALVDCCKSFESTMKIICHKRGWPFDPNKSTASELIKTCLDRGLIPSYWENHFAGLRSMLTSGIPTARNRQGGHGAGTAINNNPPSQLVSYVLHMTASTILFLAESDKNLSP
jgi:hypothetical protein